MKKVFLWLLIIVLVIVVSSLADCKGAIAEEVTETVEEELEELKKEELGNDQRRLISMFGYPDQFIIIFDEGNNNLRIDTWMYEDMEACFIFEDGKYNDVEEFIIDDTEDDSYNVVPEDFTHAMAPEQVEKLIGEQGMENIDELTGLKVITFGKGIIICVFNPDDGLINIARQKRISTDV